MVHEAPQLGIARVFHDERQGTIPKIGRRGPEDREAPLEPLNALNELGDGASLDEWTEAGGRPGEDGESDGHRVEDDLREALSL